MLEAEVAALARDLPNVAHVAVLPQGLHNAPSDLRARLQEAIDAVERDVPAAEAIALGYGLCSRGVEGVRAARCRLVLARAHDCVTHLLGDRERYARYVAEHPGTYWYSVGWNRHHVPPGPTRWELLRARYAERYGEDNADFLMEAEQGWFKAYDRATFVDLGLVACEAEAEETRRCAAWLGWSFDRQRGDPTLLRDLLAGNWDEQRFLVLEPGQTVRMTADERIVEATWPT